MKKNNNLITTSAILIVIITASLLIISILNPQKGNLISLNYKQVQEKAKKEDSFILIVSQTTCSHCAEYKPKIQSIAKKYNIDIYYIDYDLENTDNRDTFLNEYKLDGSTPITLFIKKGKQTNIFDRIEGDVSEKRVINKLKELKYI